jgi:hypothetical protein
MRYLLLFLICCFFCQLLPAQQKVTMSGYIKDNYSGESMIGATLSVQNKNRGVSSNQYGFYSITLDSGQYIFTITSVGYLPQSLTIDLSKDTVLNIAMISGAKLQ